MFVPLGKKNHSKKIFQMNTAFMQMMAVCKPPSAFVSLPRHDDACS